MLVLESIFLFNLVYILNTFFLNKQHKRTKLKQNKIKENNLLFFLDMKQNYIVRHAL